jgi:hypothetical protein
MKPLVFHRHDDFWYAPLGHSVDAEIAHIEGGYLVQVVNSRLEALTRGRVATSYSEAVKLANRMAQKYAESQQKSKTEAGR